MQVYLLLGIPDENRLSSGKGGNLLDALHSSYHRLRRGQNHGLL